MSEAKMTLRFHPMLSQSRSALVKDLLVEKLNRLEAIINELKSEE